MRRNRGGELRFEGRFDEDGQGLRGMTARVREVGETSGRVERAGEHTSEY